VAYILLHFLGRVEHRGKEVAAACSSVILRPTQSSDMSRAFLATVSGDESFQKVQSKWKEPTNVG
jgi:hypothetical protein